MGHRGKRKYKKRITYDSNESKALLGLVALFLGVLTLLSYFLEGPVFVFLKNLAADATFFLAIFFFNFSLYLFNSKFPLAQKRSVVAQLVFTVAYAAFLTSIFGGNFNLDDSERTKYGGFIGYYVYTFFSENLFLNFTPVFLFALMLVALPISLSMTIIQFLEKSGQFLQWLMAFLKRKADEIEEVQVEPETSPSTFGGFRNSVGANAAKGAAGKEEDNAAQVVTSSGAKVKIKEESVEGAYLNKELMYPDWKLPTIDLLNSFKKAEPSKENINKNADIIEQTLSSFNVKAKVVDVLIGPTVTQYALDIALGTKVSKIANLSNDLALALATSSNQLRIEAPIPGTSYVGIEIPNDDRATVYTKETIGGPVVSNKDLRLPLGLGKNINGELLAFDLQKMPHILVAGATGSGKSVLTNGFIISLLMTRTPDELKFIMVDPKQVELSDYNGIPHLLTPVITEMDKVVNSLKWAIVEMENRYTIFREAKVRNIVAYNAQMGYAALPYIVIVIDEMADMMMSTNKVESESAIVRLAQKARATGIHLILATQRPSVDVLTGLIKANIPARVGMSVATQIDSRVILDQIGAESLLGNGDMLFKDPSFGKPLRIQGMWMAPDEIQRVVQFIKEQVPEVHYAKEVVEKQPDPNASEPHEGSDVSDDDQFANALRVVVNAQKGSASLLQRKLSIGYNRAARLLDELEELGVVGSQNGSKPREVLISDAEAFLQSMAADETEVETDTNEMTSDSEYTS